MANLDEYMKDAEEHNLGKDVVDAAKGKAKSAAKKPVKKAMKKATDRLMDVTGANALKAAAKKGAKAALKAVGTAAKTGLKAFLGFLVSNPIGWIVGIVLIVAIIGIASAIGSSSSEPSQEEIVASSNLVTSSGELSEDGVAVLMDECPETTVELGDVDEDATTLRNAQQLYSVFKSYGLTDECISGILGNLSVESGIDPTGIEGIYDEPFQIGPKKQEAIADLSTYTTGTVFPLYASSGVSINQSAYQGSDGNYYCGLGLIQWTGPGAETFLRVADSLSYQWYTMNYQLAYMVSDTQYRPGFFADWKTNPSSSPEEAASKFARDYEGNTVMAQGERQEAARDWYEQMSSWSVDEALANSVLALAGSMGGVADDNEMGQSSNKCKTNSAYDNSSIASAAVSYAYATKAEGEGNNGTELYQRVHDYIFPGDSYYMSCDRGVACAVRWSGSDDEYPSGPTDSQYDYLIASPKWESLGMAGDLTVEDLQPGDVFILDGHTFLYTGSEIIQQVHGENADPSYDSVSASFGERSPGCGADASQIIARGGVDWIESRGQYEVFRCIQPDHSTTYQNAGSDSVME